MTALARLLRGKETETVEFKAKWTDGALQDLAAFANHKGGTLLVGVSDDGSVNGWSATDAELQRIANQITDTLGIRPHIHTVRHEG